MTRNPLADPGITGVTACAVAPIVGCFVHLPWISSAYYPLVGLAGALLARGEGESWVRPLVNALLLIVLAIVLLTSTETTAADRLGLLGWIALIGGAVYLFLAWRARERAAAT